MPKIATSINLTTEEASYLESLINKGTIEARVYMRAKILFLKSVDACDIERIGYRLDLADEKRQSNTVNCYRGRDVWEID